MHLTDSAGVRIVEYDSLPRTRASIRLAATPSFSIPAEADTTSEIDPRQPWLGAVVLPNGVVVLNERTALIFYSPAGTFIRRIGRRGSGPGEFTHTREICLTRSDSIVVIDYSDGRVSVWDTAGVHSRSYSRPGSVPYGGCLSDGTVIIREATVIPRPGDQGYSTYAHVRMRPDGSRAHFFAHLPGPMYAGPVIRELSLAERGGVLYAGDGRLFQIDGFQLDGMQRLSIRVRGNPPAYTQAEWERDLRAMIPSNETGSRRAEHLARLSALPRPDALPAFRRLRTDEEHRLWVQDYARPSLWTVFDARGAFLGRIDLSFVGGTGTELLYVSASTVLLATRDRDGLPRITARSVEIPP